MALKTITLYSQLVVCLFPLLTTSVSWIKLKRYEEWNLRTIYGDLVNARDTAECSRRCVQKPSTQCGAISFDDVTLECRHYTNTNVFLEEGSNQTTFITEYASVILLIKNDVTFNEAHAYCNTTFGGRISTPADMEDWYNNGGHQCLCGWMSDGIRRRVVSEADSPDNCEDMQVGIHNCPRQNLNKRVWCTTNV